MANMFNEDGTYNKTNWKAGDKITANKLNKIEESLEAINNNDISRHVEADTRLDALEEQVAGQNEVTNERIEELNDLVLDNKDELDLAIYDINSRMTFLEEELNEGIAEVHNVAETVDGKITTAEANMSTQVNRGKADMEAMVADVEGELDALHARIDGILDSSEVTSELNDKIDGVNTNLTNLIATVQDDMEAMVAEVEDELDVLDARIDALESNPQSGNGVSLIMDVKSLGAKGDGTTDDTAALQNALKNHKTLYFPKGNYLISSSLVFEIHNISMHPEAKILKNFDGVGVFVVGGASYTYIDNFCIKGHGTGARTGGGATEGHGIVVIGCRVNFRNVTSEHHRGHGIIFRATSVADSGFTGIPGYSCNMNKCMFENVLSQSNDGKGILFDGTKDDMSVWKGSFYTRDNRSNGIHFASGCQARNLELFLYSEQDGLNNASTDHSVYLDGIRSAYLTIYAEGQQNKSAREIYCTENSSGEVVSLRRNRDENYSANMVFRSMYGYELKRLAATTSTPLSTVVSNNTKALPNMSSSMFADYNAATFNGTTWFTRLRNDGIRDVKLNSDKTVIQQKPDWINYIGTTPTYKIEIANGNIDTPSDVTTGSVLYSQPIYGYKDGGYRPGGKIDYVVTGVGTGKLGVDIVFYTCNIGSNFRESFRIKQDGSIVIASLAGSGERALKVDADGKIITG